MVAPVARPSPLSSRQARVLALIAAGRTNDQIARALGIGPGTVKAHVAAILARLDATSRAQAVAVAARAGWLPETR